ARCLRAAARPEVRPRRGRRPPAPAGRGRHGRLLLRAAGEAGMSDAARDRREALWFFAIALLVLAAGLGLRAPWPSDEPRFVLVARQMFEGGDWWFPHRGSQLYPDKPPLFFWLLAGARALVGSWRWS